MIAPKGVTASATGSCFVPKTKKVFFVCILISLLYFAGCQTQIRDSNYSYKVPAQLDDGIATGKMTAANMDTAKITALTRLILKDTFPNIHSLLIARNNKLVYENYFSGKDEMWGFHLGYIDHDINKIHDIRSISKSVVSACIGIAIQQQKIKSIDDPIFTYLTNYIQYKTIFNSQITIRHLLTMSSGIRWNEDVPHNTSQNDESGMEQSLDPVAYVLKLPLDQKPGAHWNYNSGGVQVLAEIIKNASGERIDKFAEKYLFAPLGIKDYSWIKSQPNFPAAASGLRLRSRDLVKIGLMYMNEGKWNNQQILSEQWVRQSMATTILRTPDSTTKGYGYLFWTTIDTVNGKPYAITSGRGNGGQRLFIDKESNLVVVITAGNYNLSGIVNDGQRALATHIIPALY